MSPVLRGSDRCPGGTVLEREETAAMRAPCRDERGDTLIEIILAVSCERMTDIHTVEGRIS